MSLSVKSEVLRVSAEGPELQHGHQSDTVARSSPSPFLIALLCSLSPPFPPQAYWLSMTIHLHQ